MTNHQRQGREQLRQENLPRKINHLPLSLLSRKPRSQSHQKRSLFQKRLDREQRKMSNKLISRRRIPRRRRKLQQSSQRQIQTRRLAGGLNLILIRKTMSTLERLL